MLSQINEGNQKNLPITNLDENKAQKEGKTREPPPIYVKGISEYETLYLLILKVTKNYRVTALNNNVWKVNVQLENEYRELTTILTQQNMQWYTYENKHNRPIKVMARGLHPSCKTEEIVNDLKENGFKIIDCTNILKKEIARNDEGVITDITKRPLPLFMLVFETSEDIKKIYDIKVIHGMVVKIEPLRKTSTLIPQCKRCQGFNHTKRYCQLEPRCVKCAGRHLTRDCNCSNFTTPKCINCKGDHPASYRGCEIAKELQKRRMEMENKRIIRQQRQYKQNTQNVQEKLGRNTQIESIGQMEKQVLEKSFAQAAKTKRIVKEDVDTKEMLRLILEKLDEQNINNRKIIDRLNKLENSNKKAVTTKKK